MESYLFLLNIAAGLILMIAQFIYIRQVYRKEITPSLFTWFGWAVLVGVSLVAQFIHFGWTWILVGHTFSALGCLSIFLVALFSKNYQIGRRDSFYLTAGFACIFLYLIYQDPWSTTIFAIAADLLLGIPTLIKGVHQPKTEKSIGWNIALFCWGFTLITSYDKSVLLILFPLYCFLFNATMTVLTTKKRVLRKTES